MLTMNQLYNILRKKKHEIEKLDPIYIRQSDFSEGTYIIDKPGHYVFSEDIVFSPNPNNDYLPKPDNPKYQTMGYSLGFFTAISIYSKDVYLNMKGFTLSASQEFSLQQRFFSLIELADAPFLPKKGPGDFSNGLTAADGVIIDNGHLKTSSHHGIHGNLAKNVLIEYLKIDDFEFVGIALNGSDNVVLNKIEIGGTRRIPVLATYSASRFIKMFAMKILEKNLLTSEEKNELENRLKSLQDEMDLTFSEVMSIGKTTNKLFSNKTELPDGNVYGVLFNIADVAVNDFVTKDSSVVKCRNIFINKVTVKKMRCRVDEIIGISDKLGNGSQVDPAGAVLQIDNIRDENGNYRGTSLSNLQLYLAEIALKYKFPLGKNNISSDIIQWCKTGSNIQTLLNKGYKYKCNTDSMGHMNKGGIGIRADGIDNLVIRKCNIYKLKNYGCLGNDKLAGNYKKSNDLSKRTGYTGAPVMGINLSYCSNVEIIKPKIENIISKNGESIGINILNLSSNVLIKMPEISYLKAGTKINGNWLGENYYLEKVDYSNRLPNSLPISIGINIISSSLVDVKETKIYKLKSYEKPEKIKRK